MILAGSGGCGKTTLLTRYTTGDFFSDTKMTIGVDFAVHHLQIRNTRNPNSAKMKITLQIWDFGGEKRFRAMLPSFCLGSSGVLMLFDLLRPYTFFELEDWVNVIKTNTKGEIPIILLGSKFDLLNNPKNLAVKANDITEFIKKHNLKGYLNISSKTNLNIQESFEKLSHLMLENIKKKKS
jgi:small GTP-binding protein